MIKIFPSPPLFPVNRTCISPSFGKLRIFLHPLAVFLHCLVPVGRILHETFREYPFLLHPGKIGLKCIRSPYWTVIVFKILDIRVPSQEPYRFMEHG